MNTYLKWGLGLALGLMLIVAPFVYYRADYATNKRLRVVEPGKFYRSGEMTAEGFRDAIARFGIRTIINAQDAFPDPDIPLAFMSRKTIKESDICEENGVRYVHLPPNLISKRLIPDKRPEAIEAYLAVLDDPASYPILVHCKAGLHRTGVLTAIYRMERQGWSRQEAMDELKANGFGLWDATGDNDYINQYILTYRPGQRQTVDKTPKTVPQF